MSSSVAPDDSSLLAHPPGLRLDGKVAWVTGASRGLGRALAYALAGAGAEVLLMARSEAPMRAIADDVTAAGGVAHVVSGSVDDPDDVAAAAARIEDRWGKLDVLVNNAGVSPMFKRSELVSADEWRAVLDTNLYGPLACSQAAFPAMEAAGGGSIVNVSSIHAVAAHERLVAYAASKGGVEMVTRSLAVEWAPRGIRVNSIAPGYLETDMTVALREHARWGRSLLAKIPMARFGTTAEIAASTLFLASDAASYVTGATLFADGGWTAQ
jgi:NAD(P)-dependent dehydrogenase (short-subunit alcohol dehydrogenase family)